MRELSGINMDRSTIVQYLKIKSGKAVISNLIILLLFCSLENLAQDSVTHATKKPQKSLEVQWLGAVKAGNAKLAIQLADKIVPNNSISKEISPIYLNLAKREGVESFFKKRSFNKFDFKLWYDALFLKIKLDEHKVVKSKDSNELLTKILQMVVKRIKPLEKEKGIIGWPSGVWVRGYGLCDRMSWLFAEYAYQLGLDTQVVYLVTPGTDLSPHTICEVISRDKDGKVIVSTVDPLTKFMLYGTSVADLAKNPKLMAKLWSKHPNWQKALPHSIFFTPSYPQDYSIRNQQLYKKVFSKLGANSPRFGEDPNNRMLRYRKLAKVNKQVNMDLWFYPFRLLKLEMDVVRKSKAK